jgi:hypothetical protein
VVTFGFNLTHIHKFNPSSSCQSVHHALYFMNMKIYEILQTGIIDRGKNFVFIVEKMYYISADYVIP